MKFSPLLRRIRLPRCGRLFILVIVFAISPALAPSVFAQGDVAVKLIAKKVIVTDGRESLESAGKARPGDLIQYEAAYQNTSKATVKNLLATVPVPHGLAFVADTAKPTGAQASVDGKIFKPIPLTREVKK